MRESSRILRSGLLAVFLVFALAASTLAYIGQTQYTVTVVAGHALVFCDQDVTLTATVLKSSNNHRVEGATVTWKILVSKASRDALSRTTTRTNRHGRTTNELSFGHRSGNRVVKASFAGFNGTTTVKCRVRAFHP